MILFLFLVELLDLIGLMISEKNPFKVKKNQITFNY